MADCGCGSEQADLLEKNTLIILLLINAIMFIIELVLGWLAQSTGLVADSLDMFADAAVYGIALYAVGKSVLHQARAARISGVLEVILGMGVLYEVVRRLLYGSQPQSGLIMLVGTLALFANFACLVLLFKHKHRGVHMRASWIFSKNDVIANLGVILSGLLVAMTGNRYPDLIIGAVISFIIIKGGISILKEAKEVRQTVCR